ncbi:MAG: hypothetical protein JJU28_17080 [Cyclobacteriaceae bacterium]|nr:hypothetical protein [Cyclobacteriaceae bacterium]
MKRRDFIYRTSAGYTALLMTPGLWSVSLQARDKKACDFKAYRPGKTLAPLIQVTPDDGYYLHSFYDVCPWSPDQRFLAVTRLPYQQKKPVWGDTASICVIDLSEQTIEEVYTTRAWSFQVGANMQWGQKGSRFLYANDIIDGQPVCVQIDIRKKKAKAFAGPKYDLSPDERYVISPNLLNMNIHQYGYAVPDPPGGKPIPFTQEDIPNEGLWRTSLKNNKKELFVPMQRFIDASSSRDFYNKGIPYLFHSKYNRQNSRIMQVFRSQINGAGRNASLFTLNADGSNVQEALSMDHWNRKARLGGSGNHPNWHPDGEHIIMNCIPEWLGFRDMHFCAFRYDGSDFRLLSEKHLGSGHPSVEPDWRFLITDAYIKQSWVVKNDEVPIRWIDLQNDEEHILCTMPTDVGGGGEMYTREEMEQGGSQSKLDPHPVWSRDYRKICLNGAPDGKRQVFIMDVNNMF